MEHNFKVGDKVRRVNGKLFGSGFNTHQVLTVKKVDGTSIWFKETGTWLTSGDIEYVGKGDIPDSGISTDTSWQFISKHPFDINWDELAKDMSYKNPLVLVQRGERFFVVVAGELAAKAELIKDIEWKEELPNIHYCIDKGYVFETDQSLYSEWIRWAKEIKEAAWPDKDEQVVKVQVVSI